MAAERKKKVIRVLQILQTTDKKTPVNATQIVDRLENEYVIGKTDRRSIYRDIKMLQSCGYPIEQAKDKKQGWYMNKYSIREDIKDVPRELCETACKLKDYEKTGLMPEQIVEMDVLYAEKCKEVAKLQNQMETLYAEHIEEEDILKFYYCESEDGYYIGKRIDTMYYAKYSQTGFVWFMSRYLPWGKHVVDPKSLWKEHTYPSEPKEIPFFEWLQGFMKKECLGTVEECREARERQKAICEPQYLGENVVVGCREGRCSCGNMVRSYQNYCDSCGIKLEW